MINNYTYRLMYLLASTEEFLFEVDSNLYRDPQLAKCRE